MAKLGHGVYRDEANKRLIIEPNAKQWVSETGARFIEIGTRQGDPDLAVDGPETGDDAVEDDTS
jgi:hypothetical protein